MKLGEKLETHKLKSGEFREMSGEGVCSCRTKCSASTNQGQCPVNRCPAQYLMYKIQLSETLFFFIYGPILTKSHMKVGLRTPITGKILRSSYHDNGCHGNQKLFSQFILYIYGNGFVERRSGMGP